MAAYKCGVHHEDTRTIFSKKHPLDFSLRFGLGFAGN
jgi:hypothetical protein